MAIITNNLNLSPRVPIMPNKAKTLKNSVKQSLEQYFSQLDGMPPNDFYELLMAQVEPPLLEVVLKHTNNNQSKAAKLLGISRGTLRKKLMQYNMTDS
jgi:Fis family transcriptional regulator, factor for inversion stimulation protein